MVLRYMQYFRGAFILAYKGRCKRFFNVKWISTSVVVNQKFQVGGGRGSGKTLFPAGRSLENQFVNGPSLKK